ncbi:ISAon1 family transposase N-terminal region protein [Flavobacterium columnare]|uniref:ISAon1 family transposase N-terminal region protein n=1 Tax=Flavobacterium columnare TaxID=996 RepID=UPI004034941C
MQTKKDCFYIYLDEKNIIPEGFISEEYESKGFCERTLIQDFPIRGKAVYLGIRRRRWRNTVDKSEIKSDYSFIAEGSKLTVELSDFLKGTGRDPRRYDK